MNIFKKITSLFDHMDARDNEQHEQHQSDLTAISVTKRNPRKLSYSDQHETDDTTSDTEDQSFYGLNEDDEDLEEMCNMYHPSQIFTARSNGCRNIWFEEWKEAINSRQLHNASKNNVYYSIFHGIEFPVRKILWETFSQSQQFKATQTRLYQQLIDPSTISKTNLNQIQQDVPRSRSVTSRNKELRNILIAYCNYSGQDYTQGMNMIAGALLTQLSLENDNKLEQYEIVQPQYEERVFWVFVGVMLHKGWQGLLDPTFSGLSNTLSSFEQKMIQHSPSVHKRIKQLQWDMSIFAQHFITIFQIFTPIQLAGIIMDLFMIEGQTAIQSILLRMLKINQPTILNCDQTELLSYFNKGMLRDTYNKLKKDQKDGNSLADFGLNFTKNCNQ